MHYYRLRFSLAGVNAEKLLDKNINQIKLF